MADLQPAALGGAPPLPRLEAPGVVVASQPARHAGALPPAAGDGRCAGSQGHPPRAQASNPPENLPFRRQSSGQTIALACRSLLAGWAIQLGEVWSDD